MPLIDAVAVDLDGTLLEPKSLICDAARAALLKAHALGVEVYIVTGRPYADIVDILGRNDLLDAPIPQALIGNERDLHLRVGGAFEPDPLNDNRYAREIALSERLEAHLRSHAAALSAIDPSHNRFDAERVAYRGFIEYHFASVEMAEAAGEFFARTLKPLEPELDVVRNRRLIALRHKEASKGRMLAYLAKQRNIRPERILAIGDSDNDRSMLDGRLGFLAATPANGEESIMAVVRRIGGKVCAEPRGQGVAEAVLEAIA
ncbi:MAG TPA: HAD-IIB family hydrolase [Limnochordia bacterium]|nr:HAD-IIB family hydrolase [Limnochordia bacterium]